MFQLFGDKEPIQKRLPVAMTFGNFDGVHRGHVQLIQTITQNHKDVPCIAVTFFPHPHNFFYPQNPFALLCSLEERVQRLLAAGASTVVVQKFDHAFCNLSKEEFCKKWLSYYFHPKFIYVGHDFRYGKERQGDYESLKSMNEDWKVFRISPFYEGPEIISSSRIKNALSLGDVKHAAKFLGYCYHLKGRVVHGNKLGRTLGYPTANLGDYGNLVIPKSGVYACRVQGSGLDDLPAVMNCGYRPTVDGMSLQIEAHILDFNKDIYEMPIEFHFISFLREEVKFQSLDKLKNQIALDVGCVTKFFSCGT